jgi:hypothetical protein
MARLRRARIFAPWRLSRPELTRLLGLSLSHFDPNLTRPAVNYRAAKGLFGLDVSQGAVV